MEFALYLLCFLMVILISVIVSKKIRMRTKIIMEFILNSIGYIFMFIGWMIIGGVVIWLIGLLIKWGWEQAKLKYPGIILADILSTSLFIILCFAIWAGWRYLDNKFKLSDNVKVKQIVKREAFILVGTWILGIIIICSTSSVWGYRLGWILLFSAYPIYLVIRIITSKKLFLRKR